jgi:hypothetical protein
MRNRIENLERRMREGGTRLHVLRSNSNTFRITRGKARRLNGCPVIAFGVRDGCRYPTALFIARPAVSAGDDDDIIALTEDELRGNNYADH